MNKEGLQISAVEYYRMLLNWLTVLPMFDTLEGAQAFFQPEPNRRVMFCVRRNGAFEIYRMWWSGDQVSYQRDFTIMYHELGRRRERAAMELGEQQLDQLGLTHLNIGCNLNTRSVDSILKDMTANSSSGTEKTDGNLSQ